MNMKFRNRANERLAVLDDLEYRNNHFFSLRDKDQPVKEVIADSIYKTGNKFLILLGEDFIDDLKRTIPGKINIVNDVTLSIQCLDDREITILIKPSTSSMEIASPVQNKKGVVYATHTGLLKQKFAYLWKQRIALAFSKYNSLL